jgi:hypothetical protein
MVLPMWNERGPITGGCALGKRQLKNITGTLELKLIHKVVHPNQEQEIMLGFLSFAATLAIVMLSSVLIVKMIRGSGEKMMFALAGVRPMVHAAPPRRRQVRAFSSAPQMTPRLRAAA